MATLARSLGHTDHTFLSKVETGKKPPSIELIVATAQIFGVSTDQLLFDEQEVPTTKTTKVFKSGNSQAVRLPKEFQFGVDEVEIFRRGNEVVLREKPKNLADAFRLLASMEGVFPNGREQPPMQERDFSAWDKDEE